MCVGTGMSRPFLCQGFPHRLFQSLVAFAPCERVACQLQVRRDESELLTPCAAKRTAVSSTDFKTVSIVDGVGVIDPSRARRPPTQRSQL